MPRVRAPEKKRVPTRIIELRYVLRYLCLRRAKGICECCGATPTAENPLEIDHIKPYSKYPKLKYRFDNLQVLCRKCNIGKGQDETDWRRS